MHLTTIFVLTSFVLSFYAQQHVCSDSVSLSKILNNFSVPISQVNDILAGVLMNRENSHIETDLKTPVRAGHDTGSVTAVADAAVAETSTAEYRTKTKAAFKTPIIWDGQEDETDALAIPSTHGIHAKPKPISMLMNFGLDGISRWQGSTMQGGDFQNDCPDGTVFDPFGNKCRPTVCLKGTNQLNRQSCPRKVMSNLPVNATEAKFFFIIAMVNSSDCARLNVSRGRRFEKLVANRTREAIVSRLSPTDPSQVINVTIPRFLNALLKDHNYTSPPPNRFTPPPKHSTTTPSTIKKNTTTATDRPGNYGFFSLNKPSGDALSEKHVTSNSDVDDLLGVEASFILLRSPLPGSESIIEMHTRLDQVVSDGELYFDVDGFTMEIKGLWEESSKGLETNPVHGQTWCKLGTTTTYYNHEFNGTLNGSDSSVFVYQTGRSYSTGRFIQQVLIRSDPEAPDLGFSLSQTVTVCDCIQNCTYFHAIKAVLHPDKTVSYYNKTYDITEYEQNPDTGEIYLCGNDPVTKNLLFGFDMKVELSYLTSFLSILSIACLVATLLIYATFKELRTLPGWNLMNVMATLIFAHIALLTNSTSNTGLCMATGITTHYSFLLGFFFANVIAFDIYRTFGRRGSSTFIAYAPTQSIRKKVLKNIAYCHLSTFIIVLSAIILDTQNVEGWEVQYSKLCWIAGARSSLVFFAAPVIIITSINAGLIVVTFWQLYRAQAGLKGLRINPGGKNPKCSDAGQREAVSYVRIGCVFGFTWIFGIVSGVVRKYVMDENSTAMVVYEVFMYIFICTVSSQGVFIFVAFGLNAKTRERMKNLLKRINWKGCRMCQRKICRCVPSNRSSDGTAHIDVVTSTKIHSSIKV